MRWTTCRKQKPFKFYNSTLQKKNSDIDIVNEVLEECILFYPVSSFIISLYQQYQKRGSLSKKQLQGLYGKAQKVESIPVAKLATLEAIILRKPTKERSGLPATAPLYTKDESIGKMISDILAKYPEHKRVLFLRSKYDNNETLTLPEVAELQKFCKLL